MQQRSGLCKAPRWQSVSVRDARDMMKRIPYAVEALP